MSTTTMTPAAALADDATERQILVRVDRAIGIGESELRYQLEHRHDHPLARRPELLDVLAELEDRGLITSELCFRLAPQGRALLCALDDADRRADR
ncbi:MAG: hypothetical protein QOJ29_4612 [Thermoleophilaceae bacterium]|nr:hypothetical protein [Thermoleophilaceae bacterium]